MADTGLDGSVAETATSAPWVSARPEISVLISTFRRPHYLDGLLAALDAQDFSRERFEVVIVDNASGDETWSALSRRTQTTSLAMCAVRVEHNGGPSTGRNAALGIARAPFVAFTDDDCIPEGNWVSVMFESLNDGHRVVQGRTEPERGKHRGQWDHTIAVGQVTPFFETCNIAYRRDDVIAAGGFRPLEGYRAGRGGAPFGGEDTVLGWSILRATKAEVTFAADAIVQHRIEPRDFRGWLKERNSMGIFPAVVANVPEMRDVLFHRWFLSKRSATVDFGICGIASAAVLGSPIPLVMVAPYLRIIAPRHTRGLKRWLRLLLPTVAGDLAMVSSLLRGSVRHRRVVI